MSRDRVDFAVPSSARRARCRYCLQAIYWARDVFRGPLHAGTAVRVEDVTRMEAHAAHCSKREVAQASAKTAGCPADGCRERIPTGRAAPILCSECWGILPPSITAWVRREAALGREGKRWASAVDHARKLAGSIRRRGLAPAPAHPAAATTPSMFPGADFH